MRAAISGFGVTVCLRQPFEAFDMVLALFDRDGDRFGLAVAVADMQLDLGGRVAIEAEHEYAILADAATVRTVFDLALGGA